MRVTCTDIAEVLRMRQLYFFEFYEWVAWENGNDPQYSKYTPISNLDNAEMPENTEPHDLLRFSPSLNIDFPKNAEAPTLYWAGKLSSRPLPAPAPDAALSGADGGNEKKSLWRRGFPVKAADMIHSTEPSE
jgi:hypothetical protein